MTTLLLALALYAGPVGHAAVIGWPYLTGVDDLCTQVAMEAAVKHEGFTMRDVHTDKVDVEFFEVNFNPRKADSFEYVLSVGIRMMSVVVKVENPTSPNRRCVLDRDNSF